MALKLKKRELNSFEKTRRSLYAVINEKAARRLDDIASETVKTFVERARMRLDRYADSVEDGNSKGLVRELKGNISYTTEQFKPKTGKDWKSVGQVRVEKDPQNLIMYLEYGTGLVGRDRTSNDSEFASFVKKIGYRHATTEASYVTTKNGSRGWFYTKQPDSFMSNYDAQIRKRKRTDLQVVTITKGKNAGKTYTRRQPYNIKVDSNSVFSMGIKPARFLYDTRLELSNLLKRSKTVSQIEDGLNKLKEI